MWILLLQNEFMNLFSHDQTSYPLCGVGVGGLSTGTCCMIQKQSCPTCTFSQSHSPETLAGVEIENGIWKNDFQVCGLSTGGMMWHWISIGHTEKQEMWWILCQIYRIGGACSTLGWRYQGGSRMKGADLEVYELEMWISSHWCMDGPWNHVCGWRIVWGGWRKTLRREPWGIWI